MGAVATVEFGGLCHGYPAFGCEAAVVVEVVRRVVSEAVVESQQHFPYAVPLGKHMQEIGCRCHAQCVVERNYVGFHAGGVEQCSFFLRGR